MLPSIFVLAGIWGLGFLVLENNLSGPSPMILPYQIAYLFYLATISVPFVGASIGSKDNTCLP